MSSRSPTESSFRQNRSLLLETNATASTSPPKFNLFPTFDSYHINSKHFSQNVMANSNDSDDFYSLVYEQHLEVMAAEAVDSDYEFAFSLQLQEALAASMTNQPSSSTQTISPGSGGPVRDDILRFTTLQSQELAKLEQEIKDRKQGEIEMRKSSEELNRRIHDQKLAKEIQGIPEEDWRKWGDHFERPFGEGCSSFKGLEGDEELLFRLYFKGLVSEEKVMREEVVLAGIGVAICDPSDNVIFELKKPGLLTKNRTFAEGKALIEGLNAALSLGLKRVIYHIDYYPLYQFVSKSWPPKRKKIATLLNQVTLLQQKFKYCSPKLIPRNDVKFAFKLAREAIIFQTTKPAESCNEMKTTETCVICLEDTSCSEMFLVDDCKHQFCFSCMRQHVEVKLLHGMVPRCPHEGCNRDLVVESCRNFLTPKSIEIMQQRIREASIPVTEKIYCPYPRCSALMSKTEVLGCSRSMLNGSCVKCIKCHALFCLDCRIPWHSGMTCNAYRRLNPNPPAEDVKLKSLATVNLWRQCVKCNHIIELAEGCYHMTCRCGYEFCYNCGAEWKDKRPTCSCPLWDEDHILYDEDRNQDDDGENEDDSNFSDSSDEYEILWE